MPPLRRAVPQYPGLYTDGCIGGVDAAFTVYTGATHTILSSRVYERIQPNNRPKLVPGGFCPSAAYGRYLGHRGSASFKLSLGQLSIRKKIDVTDITDDILLGAQCVGVWSLWATRTDPE